MRAYELTALPTSMTERAENPQIAAPQDPHLSVVPIGNIHEPLFLVRRESHSPSRPKVGWLSPTDQRPQHRSTLRAVSTDIVPLHLVFRVTQVKERPVFEQPALTTDSRLGFDDDAVVELVSVPPPGARTFVEWHGGERDEAEAARFGPS